MNILKQEIDASGLPLSDYVQWAVAAEKVLDEYGWDDVSCGGLQETVDNSVRVATELEKRGLKVLDIERKIHDGFDLEGYTIDKGIVNDKLSLIEYYVS